MLMPSSPGGSRLDDPAENILFERDRNAGAETTGVGGTLDLQTFWLILCWRARLIAGIILATVAVATAALLVLPPKYLATTIVMVDPREPHVTNTPAVLAGIGPDAAAVESQVEIIQSSALAGKVVAALQLADDPEFALPSLWDEISRSVRALLGSDPYAQEQTRTARLIYKFQQNLTVRRRGLTYVLEISYASKEPAKAARIANAVAQAYLADQRQTQSDMNARASTWLDARIEEMRQRVSRSEEAVEKYRSAHNIVDVTQGNKLINRQIEDLTQQIALARTRTADARARLEQVEQAAQRNGDPATLNEALQSQVIANLRSQYAEGARLEAEYSTIYGEKYPGLISVRAQLSDLRRQIGDEIGRILVGVRNDYQTAVSRENALEGDLATLEEQFAVLDRADVKLHELEREAQADRNLFEQFLSRAKETAEQQSLQIADARIVSPALPPLKPNRPGTLLLIFVAACGGIIFAVTIVLILEQSRQGFRSLREASQFLSLPALGILPQQAENASVSRAWRGSTPITVQRPTERASRFALHRPGSPYARHLRAIRSRLLQSELAPMDKVVTVVSALPGEGKSTFACNFGLAAAASGIRTLLIDGDVYTAATSRVFGLKSAGLLEVLDDKISFWNAASKDVATGLHLLGACALSARADELQGIDAGRLAFLLGECRKQFDLVVLDSPAILPVGGITPHIKCADSAVLLVEWDRTARRAVAEALDMLDVHALKLAGVVLNKVSMRWFRLFDYGGRYAESPVELKTAA